MDMQQQYQQQQLEQQQQNNYYQYPFQNSFQSQYNSNFTQYNPVQSGYNDYQLIYQQAFKEGLNYAKTIKFVKCIIPKCTKTDHTFCPTEYKRMESERSHKTYHEKLKYERITCGCGSNYVKSYKAIHLQTNKHRNWEQRLNID